jgi:lysophospholipase L1-like esterase
MNEKIAKIISRVILADKTVKIKLLGDSITHGVGGTGFDQNGVRIVPGFARNKEGYCWAKLFKEYMEEQFNCVVNNNACTGTDIDFVIENFDSLVENDDDIIICTIGTNNRHQTKGIDPKRTRSEQLEFVYNKILKLVDTFKKSGKDVIFVANIPASATNELDGEGYWRIIHMNDINDLYLKASVECDFPFISMYSLFSEYCELKSVTVDSLLADGLHPNDKGYEVMFALMLKALGIGKKVKD